MNYSYIENLVTLAKQGDTNAKEALVQEFSPMIFNLSKRSFINSYELADIQNECYRTLFKCVSLYKTDKHRFVAYATNAIKNSVNHLIRTSVKRKGAEGSGEFTLDGNLENILYSDIEHIDDIILYQSYIVKLNAAIKRLNYSERELISYVYFERYSIKKYAELNGIPYSVAINKKTYILKKLKKALYGECKGTYIN